MRRAAQLLRCVLAAALVASCTLAVQALQGGREAVAADAGYSWSGSSDDISADGTTITITGSGTLALAGDMTADIVIMGSADVTLDLAGYTLTGMGDASGFVTATYSGGSYALASSPGSVIGVFGGSADLTVEDSSSAGTGTITGGDANRGGGICFSGGTLTLLGGTITGNEAHTVSVSAASISSWTGTFSSFGIGGGVYVDYGAAFTMQGGSIEGNTAAASGGGVYVAGSLEFTEDGSTYSTGDATFTLAAGNISANSASSKGAGVYAGGIVTIEGGTVAGNELTATACYGAGVYVSGAADTSNNGGFSDNCYIYYLSDMTSTERSANAVGSDGSLLMTAGEVSANEGAAYGGGIYMCGAALELAGGSVSGNTAYQGGGVYVETGSELSMSAGTIGSNTASGSSSISADGGGLYVTGSCALAMTGGAIEGNAAAYGAGAYVCGSDTCMTVTGGTIAGNVASASAGGVYNDAATFAASASAVIANNTATAHAADVYANASATTSLPTAAAMGVEYGSTGELVDGWYADASGARYADGTVSEVDAPAAHTGSALALIAACSGETLTIVVTVTWEAGAYSADDAATLALVRVADDDDEASVLLECVTLEAGAGTENEDGSVTCTYTFAVSKSTATVSYYVYSIAVSASVDGQAVQTQTFAVDFDALGSDEAAVDVELAAADQDADAAVEAALSCGDMTWTFACIEEAALYIDAIAQAAGGGDVTLALLANATIQQTLAIDAGASVTLDLAGCTLSLADAADDGNVYDAAVTAASGSVLQLAGNVAVTSSAEDASTIEGGVASCGGGLYVEDGADVTLAHVTVTGNTAENGGGIYVAGGTLSIGQDASIADNAATGSGYDEEEDAYTFAISELDDADYTAGFACGGGIYVGGAGTLAMAGGSVTGNTATRGGGVYVGQGASFALDDGSIADNTAWTATVYLVNSSGTVYTLVYDYALLAGASSYYGGSYDILGCAYGGGVYCDYGSSLTMSGGSVEGNVSEWSGGGIYVSGAQDYTGSVSGYTFCYAAATFTMHDGSIADNTCVRKGGGLMLAGEGVIYAGSITGNSATGQDMTIGDTEVLNASGLGGGIYVSGEDDSDNAGNVDFWIVFWASTMKSGDLTADAGAFGGEGSLVIYSTLITENTASVLGGGIWSCHAGTLAMNAMSGAAVFDNDALADDGTKDSTQAGDDIASVAKDHDSDDVIELSNTILAGGSVTWYYDGAIDDETHPDVGTATDEYTDADGTEHDVPRYDNEADDEHDAVDDDELTIATSFAVTAVVSDEDAAAARAAATLVISSNSASRGGGIGNNGTVTAGEKVTDTTSITVNVSKSWAGDSASERPDAVYVTVYYTLDGTTYSATALTLTADDDSIDGDADTWTASFTVDAVPTGSTISVREVDVDGYTAGYAGTVQNDDGTYSLVLNGDAYGSYTLLSSGTDESGDSYDLVLTNTSDAYSVSLVKYGTAMSAGNELSGATFALYEGTSDAGTLLATAASADGTGIVTWLDADGAEVALAAGTSYCIVETSAPQGYALAGTIVLSIAADGTVTATLEGVELGEAADGTQAGCVSYDADAHAIVLSLADEALYELPSAAGPGMWAVWLVGVALMLACGVVLVALRRGEARRT